MRTLLNLAGVGHRCPLCHEVTGRPFSVWTPLPAWTPLPVWTPPSFLGAAASPAPTAHHNYVFP